VNLPLIVICLDSYSAENEWCAIEGSAAHIAIAIPSTAIFNFIRTSKKLVSLPLFGEHGECQVTSLHTEVQIRSSRYE
jgi:hypothetical protein